MTEEKVTYTPYPSNVSIPNSSPSPFMQYSQSPYTKMQGECIKYENSYPIGNANNKINNGGLATKNNASTREYQQKYERVQQYEGKSPNKYGNINTYTNKPYPVYGVFAHSQQLQMSNHSQLKNSTHPPNLNANINILNNLDQPEAQRSQQQNTLAKLLMYESGINGGGSKQSLPGNNIAMSYYYYTGNNGSSSGNAQVNNQSAGYTGGANNNSNSNSQVIKYVNSRYEKYINEEPSHDWSHEYYSNNHNINMKKKSNNENSMPDINKQSNNSNNMVFDYSKGRMVPLNQLQLDPPLDQANKVTQEQGQLQFSQNSQQIANQQSSSQSQDMLYNFILRLVGTLTFKVRMIQRGVFETLYANYKYYTHNNDTNVHKNSFKYALPKDMNQNVAVNHTYIPISAWSSSSIELNQSRDMVKNSYNRSRSNENLSINQNSLNNNNQIKSNEDQLNNRRYDVLKTSRKHIFAIENPSQLPTPPENNNKFSRTYSHPQSYPKSPLDQSQQQKQYQQYINVNNHNNYEHMNNNKNGVQVKKFAKTADLVNANYLSSNFNKIIEQQEQQSNANTGSHIQARMMGGTYNNIPEFNFNNNMKMKGKNKNKNKETRISINTQGKEQATTNTNMQVVNKPNPPAIVQQIPLYEQQNRYTVLPIQYNNNPIKQNITINTNNLHQQQESTRHDHQQTPQSPLSFTEKANKKQTYGQNIRLQPLLPDIIKQQIGENNKENSNVQPYIEYIKEHPRQNMNSNSNSNSNIDNNVNNHKINIIQQMKNTPTHVKPFPNNIASNNHEVDNNGVINVGNLVNSIYIDVGKPVQVDKIPIQHHDNQRTNRIQKGQRPVTSYITNNNVIFNNNNINMDQYPGSNHVNQNIGKRPVSYSAPSHIVFNNIKQPIVNFIPPLQPISSHQNIIPAMPRVMSADNLILQERKNTVINHINNVKEPIILAYNIAHENKARAFSENSSPHIKIFRQTQNVSNSPKKIQITYQDPSSKTNPNVITILRPVSQPALSRPPSVLTQVKSTENLISLNSQLNVVHKSMENVNAVRADYFGPEQLPSNIIRINNRVVSHSPSQNQLIRCKSNPVLPIGPKINFVNSPIQNINRNIPPLTNPVFTAPTPALQNPVFFPKPNLQNQQYSFHPPQVMLNNRPTSNLNNPTNVSSSLKYEQPNNKVRPKSSINSPSTPINSLKDTSMQNNGGQTKLDQTIINKINENNEETKVRKNDWKEEYYKQQNERRLQTNVFIDNYKSPRKERPPIQQGLIINMQSFPFENYGGKPVFNFQKVTRNIHAQSPTNINLSPNNKNMVDKNHPIYKQYRDYDDNHPTKHKKKFQVVTKQMANFNRKGIFTRNN